MITSDTEAVADHVNQALDLLAMSREYLTQSDLHQASERGWGAAAHMVKAVAIAQGWEYERHRDFRQVLNSAYLATSDDCIRLLRGITNELHGNYEDGLWTMRNAHTFNEAALRQTLSAIAQRSRATGEDIDRALEEGFRQGVAQAMSDGILTRQEEDHLRDFRDNLPENELHIVTAEAGARAATGASTRLEELKEERGDNLTWRITRRELRSWLRASEEGRAVEIAVGRLLNQSQGGMCIC